MAVLNLALLVALFTCIAYCPVQPAGLFNAFTSSFGTQEEAAYTLVRRGSGYEERRYPSKNWLCTTQTGGYSDEDQMSVFLRLFSYLGGDNNQSRKLDMAIPVSIEVEETADGEVVTACFFLEEKDQLNYPEPTNSEVMIIQRPEMTIYTREFGGYATSESTWKNEAASLKEVLNEAGEMTRSNIMYWNAYDAPFKFWNRRNEVWLVKN